MVIRLQPTQVADFWDAIKHAIVCANAVPEDKVQEYTNRALENLLSGRHECWVTIDDSEGKREIVAIGITSILQDRFLGFSYLYVDTVFGFRRMSTELGVESLEAAKLYAKNNGCTCVKGYTNNERVKQLGRLAGFAEVATVISVDI